MSYFLSNLFVVAALLTGCHTQIIDPTNVNPRPPSIPDRDFTATLSGGLDLTLTGRGNFSCLTNPGYIHLGLYSAEPDQDKPLALRLPIDLTPRTYTLVASEAEIGNGRAWAGLNVGRSLHTSLPGGTIQITSLPAAPGEAVQGSFDFELASFGTDQTISVRGSMNFVPDADATYCP
jgi:hypothetical protein